MSARTSAGRMEAEAASKYKTALVVTHSTRIGVRMPSEAKKIGILESLFQGESTSIHSNDQVRRNFFTSPFLWDPVPDYHLETGI